MNIYICVCARVCVYYMCMGACRSCRFGKSSLQAIKSRKRAWTICFILADIIRISRVGEFTLTLGLIPPLPGSTFIAESGGNYVKLQLMRI